MAIYQENEAMAKAHQMNNIREGTADQTREEPIGPNRECVVCTLIKPLVVKGTWKVEK